jgi:hypothetical protein
MKMENTWIQKMEHFDGLRPAMEATFKRGDGKYVGKQHSHCPRIVARRADEDIRHVRECHVNVRLAEAEDCADGGDNETALRKIESAIGYLTILHMRVQDKWKEDEECRRAALASE